MGSGGRPGGAGREHVLCFQGELPRDVGEGGLPPRKPGRSQRKPGGLCDFPLSGATCARGLWHDGRAPRCCREPRLGARGPGQPHRADHAPLQLGRRHADLARDRSQMASAQSGDASRRAGAARQWGTVPTAAGAGPAPEPRGVRCSRMPTSAFWPPEPPRDSPAAPGHRARHVARQARESTAERAGPAGANGEPEPPPRPARGRPAGRPARHGNSGATSSVLPAPAQGGEARGHWWGRVPTQAQCPGQAAPPRLGASRPQPAVLHASLRLGSGLWKNHGVGTR